MSHIYFSQMPAFGLQGKLLTKESWNAGSGKDPKPIQPSCQSHMWLFPLQADTLTAWGSVPPPADPGTFPSHAPLGLSVPPCKARSLSVPLASTLSGLLWCGRGVTFDQQTKESPEAWQGLPSRRRGGGLRSVLWFEYWSPGWCYVRCGGIWKKWDLGRAGRVFSSLAKELQKEVLTRRLLATSGAGVWHCG